MASQASSDATVAASTTTSSSSSSSSSSTSKSASSDVSTWLQRVRDCLYKSVLPFWLKHSIDSKHGGFFNNLDNDGKVYDTRKHVWLQARQVWMFCRIYNAVPDADLTARSGGLVTSKGLLEAAGSGMKFLNEHATDKATGHVYFCLAQDGKPMAMQRKIYSACFLCLALCEYGRAAKDASSSAEALAVFDKILKWRSEGPTALGRPVLEGAEALSTLGVPMMLLHIFLELTRDMGATEAAAYHTELPKWCLDEIQRHVDADNKRVLENVGPKGEFVDSIDGRHLNPGHAIETGWFLLDYAERVKDSKLKDQALQIIDWSFDLGWDKKHGGIFYFLDAGGYSPTQLEWNMKLWWPHCEAMVAFAYAHKVTQKAHWWHQFCKVSSYTFDHFNDEEHGEWFGYLTEDNRVSQRFKGGPYKGCFHVPRALFMVEQLLS